MAKRILVIDDEDHVRRLMLRLLQKEGYELMELDNALHLEESIREFVPDLILCDLLMPGRDGLAVCKSLQSDPETKSIGFVVVSAKSFEEDKRAAMDAGAAGYVVKPIDPSELINVVREALSTEVSIRIWGCRGSIPAPDRALGHYGGNTSCVDVALPGHRHIIFDAGTGIRTLGSTLVDLSPMRIDLLLTHYHWDHIFGFPFFYPFYVPGNEIHVYGPADTNEALAQKIEGEMGGDYFPVSIESFRASVKFVAIGEQDFEAMNVPISSFYVLHPGRTLAYRLRIGEHSLVYAPDNEILPETISPVLSGEALRFAEFAEDATVLIHDCTYSNSQYKRHFSWGHSCPEALAAVAARARVKKVILFHHDPDNSDEDVEMIHGEFMEAIASHDSNVECEPAREGWSMQL